MTVWVVRTKFDSRALDLGIIPVGWDLDLMPVTTRDGLEQLYREKWPQARDAIVGSRVEQLWAFRFQMTAGDLVIMPRRTGSLSVGRVIGPFQYRPDLHGPIRMTHPVEWLETDLPAATLGEDLRRSLVTFERFDVYPIRRSNIDGQLLAALEAEKAGVGTSLTLKGADSSPDDSPAPGPAAPPIDVEAYAEAAIKGAIGQTFPGTDLVRLVAGILRAQGLQTDELPGATSHASLLGNRPGESAHSLYVRVDVSDENGADLGVIHEARKEMERHGAAGGMIVSWTGFTSGALAEARRFRHLALRDAGAILQAVLAHYEDLPADLRTELPLKRIWAPGIAEADELSLPLAQ